MFKNAAWALHICSGHEAQDLRHSLITQLEMHLGLVNLHCLMGLFVEICPCEHDPIRLVVENVHKLFLLELDNAISEEELALLEHH